jgi:hypothetical protein
MSYIVKKAVQKAFEKGHKIHPSDPMVQDTGAWLMDIAKTIIKYGGDLF